MSLEAPEAPYEEEEDEEQPTEPPILIHTQKGTLENRLVIPCNLGTPSLIKGTEIPLLNLLEPAAKLDDPNRDGDVTFKPLVDSMWLCLEDVSDEFPLASQMVCRVGHLHQGYLLMFILTSTEAEVYRLEGASPRFLARFTGTFRIGRFGDDGEADRVAKCALGARHEDRTDAMTVPRYHSTVELRGGRWHYRPRPRPEGDRMRTKSTWLQLKKDEAYHLPYGIRDGKVGIIVNGVPLLLERQAAAGATGRAEADGEERGEEVLARRSTLSSLGSLGATSLPL